MYETFFKLKQRPFASVPRADHYFPVPGMEAARNTLVRCVERSEGAGMVVGPSGTGKTLLLQLLAGHFRRCFRTMLLAGVHLGSRRALLQAMMHELAQPYRGMEENELRLALSDYLTQSGDCPRGAVLLVDEAHSLPPRLLDEIRMLTNLSRDGEPAVRLVLAGSRLLEERFASPKLESFSQRLAARCYLEALNAAETQEYIHAWIALAGAKGPKLFPAETCHSVYKATDGVPRLINQLCDHAMLLAHAEGKRCLEPAHVEAAWADLQQLPTPWNEKPREANSGVIEFGSLDDEPQAAGQPAPPVLRISRQDDDAEPESAEVEEAEQAEGNEDAEPCSPAQSPRHIRRLLADVQHESLPAAPAQSEVDLRFDDPAHPFGEEFVEEEVVVDRYAAPVKAARPPASVKPSAAAERPDVGQAGVRTVPLPSQTPVLQELAPDDADMIVVEEGYENTSPWPARSVVPVRRQEYGRLFARLRQG